MDNVQNPEHGRLLLCQLAELRDNARLCDVTLVAEGARISAHRVVLAATTDYFKAMFTNNMAESDSNTIELKGVEATALEALINFCYYGKIRISSTNVWSVLPTACLLQLNEVKVFEAVADWVRFDQPARQQLYPQTFSVGVVLGVIKAISREN
ncbi:BTB/POZ domain protein [Teladorsagia circumcincta]|uniref:BTB/POZ domain protein n=1 Tax=Teladorsagia circumcincta TaxID=45464 RepID=A0A2G9TL23_TELCI|nr:BTB/POZ domain protein [Teladorsagia circumcincta]